MNLDTHDKLIKILMLTRSESDGESLAAVRMANKILAQNGLVWSQLKISLLSDTTNNKPRGPPPREQPRQTEESAEEMLEYIYDNLPDWLDDSSFIDSLQERLDRGRSLTEAQFRGLKRIYERIKNQ